MPQLPCVSCLLSSVIHRDKSLWEESASLHFFLPQQIVTVGLFYLPCFSSIYSCEQLASSGAEREPRAVRCKDEDEEVVKSNCCKYVQLWGISFEHLSTILVYSVYWVPRSVSDMYESIWKQVYINIWSTACELFVVSPKKHFYF